MSRVGEHACWHSPLDYARILGGILLSFLHASVMQRRWEWAIGVTAEWARAVAGRVGRDTLSPHVYLMVILYVLRYSVQMHVCPIALDPSQQPASNVAQSSRHAVHAGLAILVALLATVCVAVAAVLAVPVFLARDVYGYIVGGRPGLHLSPSAISWGM